MTRAAGAPAEKAHAEPERLMLVVDDGSLLTPNLRRALVGCGFKLVADELHTLAAIHRHQYDAVLVNWDVVVRRVLGLLHPLSTRLKTASGVLTLALVPSIVAADGREVVFTRAEERLLASLLLARGAVVSRSELMHTWFERVAAHTLKVHLSNLRVKLAKLGVRIEPFRGRGYRLVTFEPRPQAGTKRAK